VARPTGVGAVTGGVVGGAAVGVAVGTAALAYIPVLGVIAVLGGVAAGAAAGQTMEAGRQSIRYPELISMPMNCTVAPAIPTADSSLGLGIRGLLPAQAQAAGAGERSAVLVMSVAAGGRAAAAGLRSGDILLAADGQALRDAADLEERVLALAPGTPLALRVWRDGQLLELVLRRAAAPP
jgi:S1-C subfamily serine protease